MLHMVTFRIAERGRSCVNQLPFFNRFELEYIIIRLSLYVIGFGGTCCRAIHIFQTLTHIQNTRSILINLL